MDNVFANINTELTMAVVRALIFFIVGIILSRAANNVVTRWSTHKLDAHKQLLVARVASYLVLLMFFFMGLKALGFDLGC